MKLRKLGIFTVLLLAFAAFGTGCEPYHHSRVGLDVDVHSKDHGDHQDDNHDDHHDKEHHDDDQH
jgi:hypothetical protein